MIVSLNSELERAMAKAVHDAHLFHHEFVTPEHLLLAFLSQRAFVDALLAVRGVTQDDVKQMRKQLKDAVKEMPADGDGESCSPSAQFSQVMSAASERAASMNRDTINVVDTILSYPNLVESMAEHCLSAVIEGRFNEFADMLFDSYGIEDSPESDDDASLDMFDEMNAGDALAGDTVHYLREVQPMLKNWNPLVGREQELERVQQVLCRKTKNNPLLIGESGVGKTSIVFGLAARLAEGNVPERLKDCKLYMLDLGQLLAGTQYRGEMEERMTKVLDAMSKAGDKSILFIDEMQGLMSSGSGDSADAASVLLPYLDTAAVRVIGTTNYEDYNRRLSRNKGLVRRFQTIDVCELSHDETVSILNALKPRFEEFHQVTYADEALEFAVRTSSRYIQDRFQPDKAIDLIDEAGAYMQLHTSTSREVDKPLVAQVLARMAKVEALSISDSDAERLETLEPRIKSSIYGQDEAVSRVVEAVQMAKAGLVDEGKPLASLLFVGPTGVGKTEVARVLAREMGVQLVRFDMSEFAEKHTVAKFIGSPAGYVGYDDGGQLTDTVRKNPDCVLLFDEIEKAHSDIFDILLQVMDYGVLTDNKGRKAHFQNVVIIMTSNAGAQWARQAGVGFASSVTTGGAMLGEVKKTFKPEFINRLSGIVVFRDMDHDMAGMILDKKLRELEAKLKARQVSLNVTDQAHEQLLQLGYSQQYGAREMDRVITRHVKSLLMREILFGSLTMGGQATLTYDDGEFALTVKS